MKMPTGQTIRLLMFSPFTIESVKQEISKKEGIPPLCQELTFTGRALEEGHTFDDYNIQDRSTIDLAVRHGSKYMY